MLERKEEGCGRTVKVSQFVRVCNQVINKTRLKDFASCNIRNVHGLLVCSRGVVLAAVCIFSSVVVHCRCCSLFHWVAPVMLGVAGGGRVSGLERGTGQLLRAMAVNRHSSELAREPDCKSDFSLPVRQGLCAGQCGISSSEQLNSLNSLRTRCTLFTAHCPVCPVRPVCVCPLLTQTHLPGNAKLREQRVQCNSRPSTEGSVRKGEDKGYKTQLL